MDGEAENNRAHRHSLAGLLLYTPMYFIYFAEGGGIAKLISLKLDSL